ncbi:MAG TPA: hypothetical protein VEW91_07270 [bacterium]|nr:hypothetical protein [bacterium]
MTTGLPRVLAELGFPPQEVEALLDSQTCARAQRASATRPVDG